MSAPLTLTEMVERVTELRLSPPAPRSRRWRRNDPCWTSGESHHEVTPGGWMPHCTISGDRIKRRFPMLDEDFED